MAKLQLLIAFFISIPFAFPASAQTSMSLLNLQAGGEGASAGKALAGAAGESLANRAVDVALKVAVSRLEGLPLGPLAHGVIDSAASGYLQDGGVDWPKAITGSVATTVLVAVIAPEGVVAGVAVDMVGGIVADEALKLARFVDKEISALERGDPSLARDAVRSYQNYSKTAATALTRALGDLSLKN